MNHAALIVVLMLGFVLKATEVLGAEEFEVTEDVAHYQQRPQGNAAAAASASAAASADTNWNNQGNWNDGGNYNEVQPSQAIQNNNNVIVGNPAVNSNVNQMNNGYVPRPAAAAIAYNDDVSAVLGTAAVAHHSNMKLGLTPVIGGSWYATDWNDHIGNNYTFGLILDIPMNRSFSFELESGYAKYNISYGYAPGFPPYSHYFNQYLFGGNLKAYLTDTQFRPFIGGGLMGVCYENMSRGPSMPIAYNQCIGSAQLIAGADVEISRDIAIGVRGAYLIPVFNRPYTMSNGYTSAPGYEEAGAINTSFYKLMATMRIAL